MPLPTAITAHRVRLPRASAIVGRRAVDDNDFGADTRMLPASLRRDDQAMEAWAPGYRARSRTTEPAIEAQYLEALGAHHWLH
jgi:hypothetical protein